MKILIFSILFTSVIFLIIDILWLSYSVKYFYRPNLGSLLTDKPVMWAAISFYLLYIFCLSILIIEPGVSTNTLTKTFWLAVIFGMASYGTYNLTNMATIKNWSSTVVFVDLFWGGFLTGTSSTLGIFLSKKLFI